MLNDDIQALADRLMANQDLCKLIYYTDNNPLDQPDINGKRHILDKRLLLLQQKIDLADRVGTYVLLRMPNFRPSRGGHYISSQLVFEVYVHKDAKTIYYDRDGKRKKGDRAILILDRIEQIMGEQGVGIGEDNLAGGGEVANATALFSGHGISYANVEFRNRG